MRYVKPLALFQDLLKQPKKKSCRLLGLDVGDKYVGVSVSDPLNQIASPLSVLVRTKTNIDAVARDFQSLRSELSLLGLVVGTPTPGPRGCNRHSADVALKKLFIEELRRTGELEDLKYTFWDENFSSKIVQQLLEPLNLPHIDAKTMMDKFAAVVILQDYLDYMHRNVEMEEARND